MCLGMGLVLRDFRKQPWYFLNRKRTQSASQGGKPSGHIVWRMGHIPSARCCFSSAGQVKDTACPGSLSHREGAELLSAHPAHRSPCGYSQDPPGQKAADSLTGPKGASSNRCNRKCAGFVFMEIPQTVSGLWGSPLSVRKRHMGYFYLTVLAFLL